MAVWRNLLKPAAARDLNADLTGDGQVTQADVTVVKSNYLATLPEAPPAPAQALTAESFGQQAALPLALDETTGPADDTAMTPVEAVENPVAVTELAVVVTTAAAPESVPLSEPPHAGPTEVLNSPPLFPLSPALSPGERENPFPLAAVAERLDAADGETCNSSYFHPSRRWVMERKRLS